MGKTVCQGILVPLITPFDLAGEVDEAVLREMAEFMVRSGVHGLFILGSAGQGPVMTVAQRMRAAEAVTTQVCGRIPVVTHVGCADTESTVELALHAKACGSAAIAVVPPFYYSDHSDNEILEHVRAVATAVGDDCPVFLYDNPLYTGIHLTPEKVRQYVTAIPSLCGIKAAYIGVEELLRYVRLAPPSFAVFSGSIFNLLATVPLGVKGAIHPPTSFFPELCVGLWDAIQREQWKEAFDFQRALFELTTAMGSIKEKGRAALAAVARLRGFAVQRYPRWKTEELSASQIQTLELAVEKAGIALRVV
ncbi:MAG: dihydrodipicolinate synthase family protein [Acidobacteriota bacterium]